MKIPNALVVLVLLIALSGVPRASEYENDDDDRSGHVPVVAHQVLMLSPGEAIDSGSVRADSTMRRG
jgi:hypothetical protein